MEDRQGAGQRKAFARKRSRTQFFVTESSISISLNTQGDTTSREEPKKSKQKKSNKVKRNTSYNLLEKSNQQLSDIAKFVNVEKQTPVSIGKCLGPKPPQPESQQQQYQLLQRHGKISRCNGCQCEFDKRDSTLHILGRSEYDWFIHVDRKENIKVFKLSRQNRYYCVKKQCMLARRPLLDIRSMHVACVRKDVCESVCNYVESYFEISTEYN